MPRCIRIAALLFGLVLVFAGSIPALAQSPDRLVLAFYYNWFDENTWSPAKVPDQPMSPYVSQDRGVMGRHIDQAKGAGIDALVVNWWGPQGDNQTETNFRAMLDEAAARGFSLALDVDMMSSPYLTNAGGVQAALETLLSTHAKHGAYLKVGGKPVIFFVSSSRLDVGTWAAIRNAVDPNHETLWIEEGVDVSPLSVFDGHHLYSVSWNPPADLTYTANKFARWVRAKATALGSPKVYVGTVMPGYDDRKTGRGNAFATDREEGAYYERSWQAALGAAPDWIVITSFNEWPEGTYIEPSQTYGNRFLELTAKWAAVYRSGGRPSEQMPAPTPAAQPTETIAPSATPTTLPTVAPALTPTPSPLPTLDPIRRRLPESRWDRLRD